MSANYKGVLAQKLPAISLMGFSDPDARETYANAARERHAALFQEFGIEPPAPDDRVSPAWRDLALALARRHVPAFSGAPGRPSTARDIHIKWLLASYFFQYRDGLTARDADRQVAAHFGEGPQVVLDRLKDLRRLTEFKAGGPLDQFVSNVRTRLGNSKAVEALSAALTPDADFDKYISDELERIRAVPY